MVRVLSILSVVLLFAACQDTNQHVDDDPDTADVGIDAHGLDADGSALDVGPEDIFGGCTPESDWEFCTRRGAECGELTEVDNCGQVRSVDCDAFDDLGCGVVGRCGDESAGEVPTHCVCPNVDFQSPDAEVCSSLGAECGVVEPDLWCRSWSDVDTIQCGDCEHEEDCGLVEPNRCQCPCTIDGQCRFEYQPAPNDSCVSCQPDVSTTSWTPVEQGVDCGQGGVCDGDGECGCAAGLIDCGVDHVECIDADSCDEWELTHVFDEPEFPQFATISRDGSTIAYADAKRYENTFYVRDAHTGDLIWSSEAELESIRGVALGADGEYLAIAGHDSGGSRGLFLYHVPDEELVGSDTVSSWSMRSVAMSPDSTHAAWGRGTGGVRFRSVPGADARASFSPAGGRPWDIDYGSNYVIHTSGAGIQIHAYDDTSYDIGSQSFSESTVRYGVTIADNDDFLAYAVGDGDTGDGDIRIREVGGDWEEIATLSVSSGIKGIDASGNGDFLAVEDRDADEIVIFESENWTEVARLDDCGVCMVGYDFTEDSEAQGVHPRLEFSADASRLIVPSAVDGQIFLYQRVATD